MWHEKYWLNVPQMPEVAPPPRKGEYVDPVKKCKFRQPCGYCTLKKTDCSDSSSTKLDYKSMDSFIEEYAAYITMTEGIDKGEAIRAEMMKVKREILEE